MMSKWNKFDGENVISLNSCYGDGGDRSSKVSKMDRVILMRSETGAVWVDLFRRSDEGCFSSSTTGDHITGRTGSGLH